LLGDAGEVEVRNVRGVRVHPRIRAVWQAAETSFESPDGVRVSKSGTFEVGPDVRGGALRGRRVLVLRT
jgi:hypothetical protein